MIKIGDKFINKRTSKQYEFKKYKNNKYALLESFDDTIWDYYDSIKEANTEINDDIKKGLLIKVEEENNTNFTKNDIKNIVINYLSGSDDEALDLLLQDNEVDTSGCNISEFFKVMDCIRELYSRCK